MKTLALCVVLVLVTGCNQALKETGDVVRQYNAHWQQEQDRKLAFCYQHAPTMEEVVQCMLSLSVFI